MLPDDLFNGYIGAQVAFALHRLGALTFLKKRESASLDELANRTQTDRSRLAALLRTAERLGLVESRDRDIQLTTLGHELATKAGYFTWVVGGYTDLLLNLADLADGRKTYGRDVFRNERNVVVGSAEVDVSFMAPIFDNVLASIDFDTITDIGCGSATRLIRICQNHPNVKGVGVDISPDTCNIARQNVVQSGMRDRIEIVCADILDCIRSDDSRETFRTTELVASFFMLHDLFDRGYDGGEVLSRLRVAFPSLRYMLLADTVRSVPEQPFNSIPIFTLGFELVHEFMGVFLHPKHYYDEAFAAAGLAIERCIPFGAPSSWLYLVRAEQVQPRSIVERALVPKAV